MNNTNQQLYAIYQNVFAFYKYRNLISIDDEYSQADFAKKIQKDKYILLSAINESLKDNIQSIKDYIENFNEKSLSKDITITHILLIYPGTECESKRAAMMKFVNHIRYPRAEILIITPTKLSNSVIKGLNALTASKEHKHHIFKAYTYTLLNEVIPEYELCPKYKVITDEEVEKLKETYELSSLPRIFENDPPMIWIGAKVGQVVQVKLLSETTLINIKHRLVVPPLT